MPEQKFYISDREREELFEFVSANQGEFIPDLIYDAPKYEIIKTKEGLSECIDTKVVGFYIVAPSFQIEPMVLRKLDMGDPKYKIDQRTGGPYIDISFYRGFADDAAIKHKSTIMFYYARYMHYDSDVYEEFKAPDELKAYYNMLVKYLKSKCKRIIASNEKKYWVSESFLEESTKT